MIRTANSAANTHMVNYINRTQGRLEELQLQVASEQKSQDYAGIAGDTRRLVGMETMRMALDHFVRNNEMVDLQLTTADTAVGAARATVADFRSAVLDFSMVDMDDEQQVRLIQETAFNAMQSLEGFLNTKVDGRYLFAGGRATTEPVDLGLTTLADFQARFDGAATGYPTSRDAHLAGVDLAHADTGDLAFDRATGTITAANAGSLANIPVGTALNIGGTGANDGLFVVTANDGTTLTVAMERFAATEAAPAAKLSIPAEPEPVVFDAGATGGLNFDAAAQTVTAAVAGSLADIPVGGVFTVEGSPGNDGRYTVLSNDGTTIAIETRRLADETPAPATSTLSAPSWYRGDTLARSHGVAEGRSIDLDITAIDPAFEKAIRAMGLIAQGTFGKEGGLDQNARRIDDAMYLLNSALDRVVSGTPPFGPERAGGIEDVQRELGFNRDLIQESNLRHKDLIATLESRIADIEHVDINRAVTELLDQSQSLEASFKAIATLRGLSLMNFM